MSMSREWLFYEYLIWFSSNIVSLKLFGQCNISCYLKSNFTQGVVCGVATKTGDCKRKQDFTKHQDYTFVKLL